MIMAVSGCNKRPMSGDDGKNTASNQEQKISTSSEVLNKQEVQIDEDDKYKGVITEENDGWRLYSNGYFGIEFRYKNENGDIEFIESSNGISLIKDDEDPAKRINYASIDFYPYFNINGKSRYETLLSYLELSWNQYQHSAELLGINEIVNNNNVRFYDVKSKVNNFKKPDEEIARTFESNIYYTEYCEKDFDYTSLTCHVQETCQNILDSLKINIKK